MGQTLVQSSGMAPRSPARLWPVVGDFTAPWHPFIEWIEREPVPSRIIRRFSVSNDDTIYREELTYISNADHTYTYRALDGIEGAKSYVANLQINGVEQGSEIRWQAEIDALENRINDISNGTRTVFDAGINSIKDMDRTPVQTRAPRRSNAETDHIIIKGTPNLSVTVAPKGLQATRTLCLFLHGIGGNRTNWDAQLGKLGHDYPVAALDLRGYGDSKLGDQPSSIDAYCDDILSIMTHFNASKVVLIGLSYGSWIATSFAMRHSEKLAGLVLSGGCTGMSEADQKERDNFRTSREVPMDAGQTPADFAASVVDIISGPNATDEVRNTLHASMAAISSQTYRDALNCFCNPSEKFDFSNINCPVLMMTGEFDRLAPPDEIREISLRIHDAKARPLTAGPVQFEVIENAGHVCNLEQPHTYNKYLGEYLRMLGVKRPTSGQKRKFAAKQEKHQRILDAALKEFAQNGYAGASMQAIAETAGVSKPTLYQYIGQKEDVFAAILETGRKTLLLPFEGKGDAEMVPTLWDFSKTYADFVLSSDILAIARVVIGEAERVPDLAKRYYDNGPGRAFNGIKRYLDTQRDKGRLMYDDTEVAAEHLWALILSAPRTKAMHFPSSPVSQETLEKSVRSGLMTFIRAYSTNVDDDIMILKQQVWRS